jgi:hypothetical protein
VLTGEFIDVLGAMMLISIPNFACPCRESERAFHAALRLRLVFPKFGRCLVGQARGLRRARCNRCAKFARIASLPIRRYSRKKLRTIPLRCNLRGVCTIQVNVARSAP